eukprot:5152_1
MAELPSTPRRFNRSQQVHGRAQSAPPIHKKRMKVTNKASYTKCEISDALDYYDDNITEKALSFIVVELKKKKMFHSLKINTMKTWVRRYPKGSEARRKLREQGESKRTKSKLYPELEQALWNEIDRREKESLLRDVDTMQMWCVQLVEKWIKEGKHHYDNCKVSRGWMYDTIEEWKIKNTTVTGQSGLTWAEYVPQAKIFIKTEREWLSENGYVDANGYVIKEALLNPDEVPMCLKGKSRKQLNTSNNKETKVKSFPITFDATKRFATIIPVTGYDKIEYVEVTMKASPRQSELNKYPTDRTIGYTPSKKAYCNKTVWLGLGKGLKRAVRRKYTKEDGSYGRCVIYQDNYGVHIKYGQEFSNINGGHHNRALTKKASSKQQAIDQHLGLWFQVFIKKGYYMKERAYTELCLAKKQHTFKKENLGSMRIWFMNEIKKAKDEINKNHTQLIKNSWNNSLLVAKCDGSEDEVYLAAPQKKLSKRQFAAKMFLYETDSESDEVESESESEGKKK